MTDKMRSFVKAFNKLVDEAKAKGVIDNGEALVDASQVVLRLHKSNYGVQQRISISELTRVLLPVEVEAGILFGQCIDNIMEEMFDGSKKS